jgi:hypothetical protein
MGTVAETAKVDYLLSFAKKGKQTFIFRFPLAENKRKFAVSVFRLQQTNGSCRFPLVPFYVYIIFQRLQIYINIYIHSYLYLYLYI